MAMTERKAPDQFKFEKQGARLVGILTAIDQKEVGGKATMEYAFDLLNKDRVTCLGTADLDKKIRGTDVGFRLDILFENLQKLPNQQAGHSDMKIFKVLVNDKIEPGYEHLRPDLKPAA